MEGFNIDEDERRARGTENGESWACEHGHAQHRRSKSASDRNLELPRGGVLLSVDKGLYESSELLPPVKTLVGRSPLHECAINANVDATHRASLEKDIVQLQLRLQQEKSMRMFLERAMGRASSTLSPGHRHFATQTKELIAEIELLEEEVANREQHVLSLYRSIFDQCVSRPPSEQSSGIVSPAHTKTGSRKHPSIISSAFCSSKKFPFCPFQALASINDSTKRTTLLQSRTRHASLLSGKGNMHFEKICSNNSMVKERVSTMEKNSMVRTLKDHLYQCPSKLSEEMVRCMAAVYCWLSSTASSKIEQNQSPTLSRSSTHVRQPRHGTGVDRDWSCKSVVEISWISTDKKNNSHASYAINNYRVLVEQLERVNVNQMDTTAQTAFWINMYNSLVMHAYLAYGIPHSSLRRLALFQKAVYNIGGNFISANAIEQSIFCFRTPRIGRWLETILSTVMRKRSEEERQHINSKFGLKNSEPLIFFTLCTGASSDPMLRVYTATNIKEELEVAKREFLQSNVIVKKSKKVFLPRVLERFGKEASIPIDNLLRWVTENVDKRLHDSIQKCIDCRANKKPSQIIEWLPYSSRFGYAFSKDLTGKPWWL